MTGGLRYFEHPESDALWSQPAGDAFPTDPLVVELDRGVYERKLQMQYAARELEKVKGRTGRTRVLPMGEKDPVVGLHMTNAGIAEVREHLATMTGRISGTEEHESNVPKSAPLHVSLRPKTFDAVIGQDATIKALTRVLNAPNAPHLYLLTGPSGTGKTTIGRLIASAFGCTAPWEMDAATHSGVDETREISQWAQYLALDGSNKVLILDECHALSKAAWQALLKVMEEPPSHVYFVLCTTEAAKVPETIKTRATQLKTRDVDTTALSAYAEAVVAEQGLVLPDGALRYIVQAASGSIRALLVALQTCDGAADLLEVQRLLEQATEDDALKALMQMVVSNRRSMSRAKKMLLQLKEGRESEAVRIPLLAYVTAVYLNTAEDKGDYLIPLLDTLSKPTPSQNGWGALIAALHYGMNP